MPSVIVVTKQGAEVSISTPAGLVEAIYNKGWMPKTGTVASNFAAVEGGSAPLENMNLPITVHDLTDAESPASDALRAASVLAVKDAITAGEIDVGDGSADIRALLRGSDRIKQMAVTPAHNPTVMSSPPTITQNTTVTAGLTATYTASHLRWSGPLATAPTVGGSMQPRGSSTAAGVEHFNARAAQMAFDFDGQKFDINLRAYTSLRYRIWVNEQPNTADLNLLPSGTGANAFLQVDLGSASRANPRRIVVEFEDTSNPPSVLAVRAAPTDLLSPPSIGAPRIIVVGDSYSRGEGGTTRQTFSYARSLSRMMGWADCWHTHTSYAGTGLVHANDASYGPYGARAQYDVYPYNPAAAIIQGSVNDATHPGEVGPALTAYVTDLRDALPDAVVVVTSPLFVATPSAAHLTIAAEMEAAAATLGVPYVDCLDPAVFTGTGAVGSTNGSGNADWARHSDFTHPTNDGAFALARHVAGRLSQLLGLPT
jgi:lysophospholipase L1-like esterase